MGVQQQTNSVPHFNLPQKPRLDMWQSLSSSQKCIDNHLIYIYICVFLYYDLTCVQRTGAAYQAKQNNFTIYGVLPCVRNRDHLPMM